MGYRGTWTTKGSLSTAGVKNTKGEFVRQACEGDGCRVLPGRSGGWSDDDGLQGESERELEALMPSVLERAFRGEM
jgi:hypothetical protein